LTKKKTILGKEKKLKEKWQFVINNMVAIKEDKKINRRRCGGSVSNK
jgi:hypothetical protein